MIKLKKLIKENVWDRKFGEPLPTLKDIAEKHQRKEKQELNEGIDLHSHVVLVKSQLERFKDDLNAKRVDRLIQIVMNTKRTDGKTAVKC